MSRPYDRQRVVRKKKKWGKVYEYTPVIRDLFIDDDTKEKIVKDVTKDKIFSPQAYAAKYNINVSTMKKFFEELRKEGKIKLVYSSSRIKLYSRP